MLSRTDGIQFLIEKTQSLSKELGIEALNELVNWEGIRKGNFLPESFFSALMNEEDAIKAASIFENAGLDFVVAQESSRRRGAFRLYADFEALQKYHWENIEKPNFTFPIHKAVLSINFDSSLFKDGLTVAQFQKILSNTLEKDRHIKKVMFTFKNPSHINEIEFPKYLEATNNEIEKHCLPLIEELKFNFVYAVFGNPDYIIENTPKCLKQANDKLKKYHAARLRSHMWLSKTGPDHNPDLAIPRELVGMMFQQYISPGDWTSSRESDDGTRSSLSLSKDRP